MRRELFTAPPLPVIAHAAWCICWRPRRAILGRKRFCVVFRANSTGVYPTAWRSIRPEICTERPRAETHSVVLEAAGWCFGWSLIRPDPGKKRCCIISTAKMALERAALFLAALAIFMGGRGRATVKG